MKDLDLGLSLTDIPMPKTPSIDPSTFFFESSNNLEIEIGCGKGTFLVDESIETTSNILGIEWAKEYWKYALDRVQRRNCRNVRVLWGDATEFLTHWCDSCVVDVIHLYFSDPWPKSRHHKRRVVQVETLKTFYRVLKSNGRIHIVTDHKELWDWNLACLSYVPDLFLKIDFHPENRRKSNELVGTNFERKYRKEGREFYSMTLKKSK